MTCSRCAAELPAGARFCPSCGAAVVRTAAEGERRVVTVLFCDVKGSTAIAESLDPEEWADVMKGAFASLIDAVGLYDGTVARLMGDAVLAFFGAPRAHEDDPERAILAAFEMKRAMAVYREQLRAERGIPDFDIRVGINTGLAILGEVGSGTGIEYTAMGDAVNVAARLQQAAPPDGVLIGDATRAQVHDRFEVEPLGALEVRGRSAPVQAFLVRSATPPRHRTAAVPLVGRSAELAALRGVVRELRGGRGGVVTIIADAGLGKTRLLEELRAESQADAAESQPAWSTARALSYGTALSYGVFAQQLQQWLGGSADEPPAAQRSSLAELARSAGLTADAESTLAAVLGVGSGAAAGALSGESFRAELVRAAAALVRHTAARSGMVIVFDDLHWADAASVELVLSLLPLVDEAAVLVLCAFRPDRRSASWRVKQLAESDYPHVHTDLSLAPLPRTDSELLLRSLLEGAQLPSRLRERLLDKAEGNPLFIEELVRALLGERVLEPGRDPGTWAVRADAADVRLPETIQGIVGARIDRLDDETRHTLQAAAVIGRTFQYRVLERIAAADGALDRQLATMQRVELVRELGRDPERLYAFRHALTQEAAYGSMLQRRRRELHRAVADSLLALYADRAEEYAGLVGRHLAEAGDAEAIGYLRAAGERALRLHALEDAVGHFSRALLAARDSPLDPATLAALYLGRGRAHELRGEYDAAMEGYRELERIGRERGNRLLETSALAYQVTLRVTPTPYRDLDQADEILARAVPAARELGDRGLVARLLWNQSQAAMWRDRFEEASRIGDEAIALARELGLRDLLAFALNDVARAHAFGDGPGRDRAQQMVGEAIDLFRELGNKPMAADALGSLAFYSYAQGDYDAVLRASEEARRLSDEVGSLWGASYSSFISPAVHYDRGNWGRAIELGEEAIELGRRAGFLVVQAGPRAELAWVYRCAGDTARAEAHAAAADELAERSLPDFRGWTLAQLARLALVDGDVDHARRLLEQARAGSRTQRPPAMVALDLAAIEVQLAAQEHEAAALTARAMRERYTSSGVRPQAIEALWYEGEALRRAGNLSVARTLLEGACEEAVTLTSTRIRWRALASLAALHAEAGDAPAAVRARNEALEITNAIARSLERVGLADSFLERADIRELSAES